MSCSSDGLFPLSSSTFYHSLARPGHANRKGKVKTKGLGQDKAKIIYGPGVCVHDVMILRHVTPGLKNVDRWMGLF